MPEVVAVQSGPQGRASDSWDVLARNPSPIPEELGERSSAQKAEEARAEPAAQEPESEPEARAEAQELDTSEGEKQQQADGEKKPSRYERTKRQRKAFEVERSSFEAQRKAFAEERRAFEQAKRKAAEPPYTLAELKQYRKSWEKEGNFDLVEKADAEISRLEQLEAESADNFRLPKSGTPEFIAQWEAAEKELYSLDPEFQRENTRLDKVLRATMAGPDGNVYRQHPRGIVAAYHRARLDIAEHDLGVSRGEIQKLKQEIQRLNGLLGIGGGATGGRSIGEFRGKDFATMSSKEMREHLKRSAARSGW